jgi:hypothetical protein
MRKLKLSIDALQVESFHAVGPGSGRGTVPGHNPTYYLDECQTPAGTCDAGCTQGYNTCGTCMESCWGTCVSCAATCNGTCGNTCGNTCGCGTGGPGGPVLSANATECGCETWETCANANVCA